MTAPWPLEREELLKKLWADGLNARQISERFGCTKNAIHGKLDRLGLITKKEKPSQKEAPPPRTKFNPFSNAGKKPEKKPIDIGWNALILPVEPPKWSWPPLTSETQVSLVERRLDQCGWPNDGSERDGTYRVCGEAVADLIDGKPAEGLWYCPCHYRMAYRAPHGSRPKVYARRSDAAAGRAA